MKFLPLILLASYAAVATAEDTPAVTPATPPPAPAPGANPTPLAPQAGIGPQPAPPASPTHPGNAAAAAAGENAPQREDRFSASLELDGGYDSNVLLQDNNDPQPTDDKSIDLGGEAKVLYRALQGDTKLNLIGDARYDDYPSVHVADYARLGVGAVATTHLQYFDPGVVLGFNRLYLDGAGVASVGRFSLTGVYVDPQQRYADSAILDVQSVHYDQDEPDTGILYDVLIRHWWLWEAGNSHRRVEFNLMASIYAADQSTESYKSVSPALAFKDRFTETPFIGGVLDVEAGAQVELRRYDQAFAGLPTEHQTIYAINAAADRWFSVPLSDAIGLGHKQLTMSVGIYVIYTDRASNLDGRSFNRLQEGVRFISNW